MDGDGKSGEDGTKSQKDPETEVKGTDLLGGDILNESVPGDSERKQEEGEVQCCDSVFNFVAPPRWAGLNGGTN